MEKSLWSIEGVPIKVTWDEWFDQTLSKWSESMRNEWIEWIEVKWVNGWKWLGTTLWEWSYGRLRVSLSKWLEMSDLIKPYQNDQNRWEMNEMKWIEVNRGEMSDLMDLMRSTLWKSPYEMNEGVPMKVTWVKMIWPNTIKWMESMRNEWIEVSRMNWSE